MNNQIDGSVDDFGDFYLDKEFFEDNETFEVCAECSKVRLTSCIWVELDEHVLKFFLKKNEHTWKICPCCRTGCLTE